MTDMTRLLESPWSRIGRWVAAALLVGALHAGALVLALMYQPDDAWDDPAGGVNVDMAAPPTPMPIKSEEDLPPGPEQQQGKEAAEAQKQVVQKVEEKDDPVVEPSPAPDPEVVLPKPRPKQKEQPKEEARDAAEKKEAREDGQEIKTAPPRVEAPPAPSSAPSTNPSPSLSRVKVEWEKSIIRQIERYRIDPSTKWQGMKGRAVVRFKMDEFGNVVFSEITQSSGSPLLDDAALRLLKRASPFRRPPPGVELDYNLPIYLGGSE